MTSTAHTAVPRLCQSQPHSCLFDCKHNAGTAAVTLHLQQWTKSPIEGMHRGNCDKVHLIYKLQKCTNSQQRKLHCAPCCCHRRCLSQAANASHNRHRWHFSHP
jgi:hypothetical protein